MAMTANQALEAAKGMDFTQMWALLMELRERQQKTDEQLRETDKRIEKRLDRMAKEVGGIGRSIGELVEILIAGKVWEKFSDYPYNLKRAYRRIKLYDEDDTELTDIDILLVDTQYAMAIEVKREPDIKDVDHHLNQMELIRKYPPLEMKVEKLLGAIAGGVVSAEIRDYAHKHGFFVLELSGEQVNLVKSVNDFTAKEW